eukprot:gnl/TRDRNA2_/TRDRNA2_84834_c0_seq1.p1 gnl/TRDRNA2_/TRDRNA2_84834_c0~~gnl/TRDRNA2_/TRDRNA2_84834_c0_seq1.p1  ORF type:complete len:426 (-),score=65.67 gnl/TRDRNA2_/TRDRNA2_84834_c0_seq1:692-1930(-)
MAAAAAGAAWRKARADRPSLLSGRTIDPDPKDLASILTLSDVYSWLGADEEFRFALDKVLGSPTLIRQLVSIPLQKYLAAMRRARVVDKNQETRPLKAAELHMARGVRRVARLCVGLAAAEEEDASTEDGPALKRRRLVVKQPAPEVYRLLQSEASRIWAPGGSSAGGRRQVPRRRAAAAAAQGYYDILQIPRSANVAQIREAFRRRAMQTHPDKQGRLEDFNAVVQACTVLSDEKMRADYEDDLDKKASRDGEGWEAPSLTDDAEMSERSLRWAARQVHTMLLEAPQESWPDQISELDDQELAALHSWLMKSRSKFINESANEGGRKRKGRPSQAKKLKCIMRISGGYRVQLTWSTLTVTTRSTTSEDLAIRWHIALSYMRRLAQVRLSRQGEKKTTDFRGRVEPNAQGRA